MERRNEQHGRPAEQLIPNYWVGKQGQERMAVSQFPGKVPCLADADMSSGARSLYATEAKDGTERPATCIIQEQWLAVRD